MIFVTDETFPQEVLQSELPVLVDFYADWCPPCKASAPAIDAIAEEYAGKIKVVKSNVDQGSKYALENGVRGIPNFVIFKGGQKLQQFVGWAEGVEKQIREALNAVLTS